MLDFLKLVDISDSTLEIINKTYDDAMKFNLSMNDENCLGIIIFMKKVGIKNIDDLLIDKPDWFLKTSEDLIEKIISNKELINQINEDYNNVVI